MWDKCVMPIRPFSNEQARALVNLDQYYRAWMDAERALAALPYDLRRKEVSGRSYLYEIADRSGNGRSLGRWSDENAVRFSEYRQSKSEAKARRDGAARALDETGRLCRALRTPMLGNEAGPILREADRRGLLDGALLVVGTNAMAAYAIEAGGFIGAPDETEDFDLAWTASTPMPEQMQVWPMLKAADATYTVNSERSFQARNARAYEVELLVAPSRAGTLARRDQPRPVPLPEQEWLLLGQPADRVVICRDGSPARLVVPDPRWFALQKLWMARQPKRHPLKRGKDEQQGTAMLDAIADTMPHYPLDRDFEIMVPDELAGVYAVWRARPRVIGTPSWL
jgi:hypothetical protein